MKIAKNLKIFAALLYTIVSTYSTLYPKYIYNSLITIRKRLVRDPGPQTQVKLQTDDDIEDEAELQKDLHYQKTVGKLQYKKLTPNDISKLEYLIQLNLSERCVSIFESTIENYKFRFLTVVLLVFNILCFLNQEFNWPRTIIFVFFQTLLTNLPFWIYVLNVVQYYKMRFKLEWDVVSRDACCPEIKCLLAFESDHCIGYSIILVEDGHAELVNIFVLDEFRNLYIGKHLMSSAMFHLKLNRISRVVCLVESNNNRALCFMENNRFQVMNKLPLSKSGYSELVDAIKNRHRSTCVYFRVLNFYYVFFEIDLLSFN